MIIVQITDPHVTYPGKLLFGDYDPTSALGATLARVAHLEPRPDLVLLTGDLTENGAPEEYAEFRRLVAGFDLPMAAIPGNHDRRAAFVDGLAETAIRTGTLPFLHLEIDAGPLRLLGLDTLSDDGAAEGLLCAERLDWVAGRLAEAPERPTLIFMHHPPFVTGIRFMDVIGCENGDRLAAIVASSRQVVGVVCGHVHRAVTTYWAGTTATICPSVAYTVPLDLGPGGPPRMLYQRPAYQLHVWSESRGLISHADYLTDDPGLPTGAVSN